jgi:hypothetical protein
VYSAARFSVGASKALSASIKPVCAFTRVAPKRASTKLLERSATVGLPTGAI